MIEWVPWVPSTEDIKKQFYWGTPPPPGDLSEADFDAWLEDHDRRVKAEAWGEGWRVGGDYIAESEMGVFKDAERLYGELTNPYLEK